MSSLEAFEATARHLSFTRAAIELGITQGAVSQRIAKLEASLGARLFDRDGSNLQLTSFGADFILSARETIVRLASAVDHAIERNRGDTLSIGCLATFALQVLVPNLPAFRAKHPELSIRLRSFSPSESPLAGTQGAVRSVAPSAFEFDVHIQFGSGSWPGMTSVPVAPEYMFPVCSRELMARSPLREPQDLAAQTIILGSHHPISGYDYWPNWLEAAGVPGLTFADELFCDPLYCALQAVISGAGVMMGRSTLTRSELRTGRLVKPFDHAVKSPFSYHLVVPSDRAGAHKTQVFCDWLREVCA